MWLYTVQTVTHFSMYYTPLEHTPDMLPTTLNHTAHAAAATKHAPSGISNRKVIFLSFVVTAYIVGIIFALLWILTRRFDQKLGPPWVPSFFRTDVCGIWLEPVARFAPALLWPFLVLFCFICSTKQKTSEATTICGIRRRVVKQKARLESVLQPKYDVCDPVKVELAGLPGLTGPAEPPEPKPSPRWLSIARSPTASPPPSYQSKTAPFTDHTWLAKPRQSSGFVSPQNSSRSNSVDSCSPCSCQSYFQPVPSPLRNQSATTQPISVHINNLSVIVGDGASSSARTASTNESTDSQEPARPREGYENSEGSASGSGSGTLGRRGTV